MSWVQIQKRSRKKSNNVRVRFRYYIKNKNGEIHKSKHFLKIIIPIFIFEKLNINDSDSVSISYSEKDPRILLIKKDNEGKNSYKVAKYRSFSFVIQPLWDAFKPDDSEFTMFNVTHSFYENGLKININK